MLEVHAAEQAGIDPDRISFTVTVQLARLKVVAQAASDVTILHATRLEVIRELLDDLPLCFPWSCKRAAGLRARHDCSPLSKG
ncbi:hypothetical protein ACIQ9Q_42440 [Streptomyces sp. NPDC094438]|uniref:hypothetical protein n=1 Tax=Streptomyces sp. NPDC094438 TaxID=3366061 RepID=UPI0037F83EC3